MKAKEGCLTEVYNMVKEFHKTFNHPCPDVVTPMTKERKKARAAWIQEEVNEFLLSDSITEDVDALVDCLYFVIGSLVEENVDPSYVFELVQKANMSKIFPDGKPHYNSQNKVIKPEGWVAPDEEIHKYIESLQNP